MRYTVLKIQTPGKIQSSQSASNKKRKQLSHGRKGIIILGRVDEQIPQVTLKFLIRRFQVEQSLHEKGVQVICRSAEPQ
jgi:hypothetical protein